MLHVPGAFMSISSTTLIGQKRRCQNLWGGLETKHTSSRQDLCSGNSRSLKVELQWKCGENVFGPMARPISLSQYRRDYSGIVARMFFGPPGFLWHRKMA